MFCLLRDLRPEDNPPAWPAADTTAPVSPHLTAACEAFDRWVAATGGEPPQWAVSAFWWASFAVDYDLSVAKLAGFLTHWRERFMSALGWASLHGDDWRPGGPVEDAGSASDALEAWGFFSDLRHSGAIGATVLLCERHRDEIARVVGDPRGYALPSALQPWGACHDRYKAAVSAEAGA